MNGISRRLFITDTKNKIRILLDFVTTYWLVDTTFAWTMRWIRPHKRSHTNRIQLHSTYTQTRTSHIEEKKKKANGNFPLNGKVQTQRKHRRKTSKDHRNLRWRTRQTATSAAVLVHPSLTLKLNWPDIENGAIISYESLSNVPVLNAKQGRQFVTGRTVNKHRILIVPQGVTVRIDHRTPIRRFGTHWESSRDTANRYRRIRKYSPISFIEMLNFILNLKLAI